MISRGALATLGNRPASERLRIRERRLVGEEHLVELSGQLDRATNDRLGEVLAAALDGPLERLVLDLSQLSLIDVSGLHPILTAHLRASDRHKQFLIIPGSDNVQRVLDSIHAPFDYIVPPSSSAGRPRGAPSGEATRETSAG